jgi:Ser/Thr protein kinase RdoA (MazF antagonist)
VFDDHALTLDYHALTPDVVLDALSSIGLPVDGRLFSLNSYENRVYQVMLDDGQTMVAKFYRPARWQDAQILEEHAFAKALMDDEIPVVGPVSIQGQTLHHWEGFRFAVFPRRGGRAPELDDPEVLMWIGRFLARIHAVGAREPFVHRPALNLQTFGRESVDWLLQSQMIDLSYESAWQKAAEQALRQVQQAFESTKFDAIRLHGDCHVGNVLWTPADLPDGGPHFVDLDDARMGPAIQDLWMLISGERAQRSQQLSLLIEGYEEMREFDRRELALIEPLRTLRLIHYSAWIARRWDDPTFQRNFAWFGTPDYWASQVQMLHEQCEAMQEPALVV